MHEAVLRAMGDLAVSDVHLRAGVPVWVRRWGRMRTVDSGPLEASDVDAMTGVMLGDGRWRQLREGRDVDAAWQMPDGDRWRVHAYRAGGRSAVTMRRIPRVVPTLQSLAFGIGRITTLIAPQSAASPLLEMACASRTAALR